VRRFRISESTLKAVAGRRRLPPDFIREVEEWLFDAGWALIFAGKTYAMIEVAAVEGWVRLSSKRIGDELKEVAAGRFDFDSLSHFLDRHTEDESEED
jgi:hypothetical protein